jgi:predicted metal-dependent hydrolase
MVGVDGPWQAQRDRVGDNLNHGQRVRLKLRNPAGGWYDYQHVVLVMLHELVHNDIGPHNKAFFKLLDEITEECEAGPGPREPLR